MLSSDEEDVFMEKITRKNRISEQDIKEVLKMSQESGGGSNN